MTLYTIFKVLHIAGVIVFLGNITVGIFWKAWADRTKDPRIMAYTIDGIILADRIFTIPGIIVLLIGGLGAAFVGHIPILSTGWLFWGIILFIIAGLAFGPVARAQRLLSATAHQGVDAGSLSWELYDKFSAVWNLWGTVALVAPIIAAVLMIAKPVLPALHG